VRSRRARRVYYTTSLEYETEIERGGWILELFFQSAVEIVFAQKSVCDLFLFSQTERAEKAKQGFRV